MVVNVVDLLVREMKYLVIYKEYLFFELKLIICKLMVLLKRGVIVFINNWI